jgi:hypothetical protein
MAELTVWQTDDCCPSCGGLLRRRVRTDGLVTEECPCGWSVTWRADWTDASGDDNPDDRYDDQ